MFMISTTSSCHQVFFSPLQGKVQKEIHAILTETLREHTPLYATVKNWVAQFKHGDFSTRDAPRPGWPKIVTTPEIIDQIHELILEDLQISAKSIAEQLDISHEWVGSIHMKIWTCGSSSRCGSWNAWMWMKNVNGANHLNNFWNFFSHAWSKWFPVVIGDHGRNLVISLWPRDKATINGLAA